MARRKSPRRGAIAPLTAILLIPLLGLVAFAVDCGYIALVRSELQAAADAAAIAAASQIETNAEPGFQTKSRQWAVSFALANRAGGKNVTLDPETDIEFGFWDGTSREWQPPRLADPRVTAVRVRARRDGGSASGPIKLFFARAIGIQTCDLDAEAIAYVPNPVPNKESRNAGTRFLIDDEMFDTDVPAIEDLARRLNKTPDELISAKNEKSSDPKDWFLNLPAGVQLELPTGQVGDEGLLDIAVNVGSPDLPQYPFSSPADHARFLKYNNTSENDPVSQMRKSQFSDGALDPLHGVGRFNQPSRYPDLVNPDFIHVSPVYKSDVSALDGTDQADDKKGPDLNGDGQVDGHTTNKQVEKGVNAKDYRRGLLAFRIVGYRVDSSKPYCYLPNLIIEIVDPATINLDEIMPVTNTSSATTVKYSSGGVHNIRLAR